MVKKGDLGKAKTADDTAASGTPLLFTALNRIPVHGTGDDVTEEDSIVKPRPGKGQKALDLEIELKNDWDPMILSVSAPKLPEYENDLVLSLRSRDVTIIVNEKNVFGYEKIVLPDEIIPQFSTAFFDRGILKLFLKKQPRGTDENHEIPTPMVWCSENVFEVLEQARANADENQARFHSVQLELQNQIVTRKREKLVYETKFASQLLLDVLDVQDNFDRAIEAAKKSRGKNSLMEGVLLIRKQIEGLLACNDVEEIEADGIPFDPMLHEAFMTEETSEVPENTITEVIQKGYMYKNKVLRLAKVKVSKQKTG